jgi:hypothetical protein
MNSTNVTFHVNNIQINSFYYGRSIFPNKVKVFTIFVANVTSNTLCVSSTETWTQNSPNSATFVDNFYLSIATPPVAQNITTPNITNTTNNTIIPNITLTNNTVMSNTTIANNTIASNISMSNNSMPINPISTPNVTISNNNNSVEIITQNVTQ